MSLLKGVNKSIYNELKESLDILIEDDYYRKYYLRCQRCKIPFNIDKVDDAYGKSCIQLSEWQWHEPIICKNNNIFCGRIECIVLHDEIETVPCGHIKESIQEKCQSKRMCKSCAVHCPYSGCEMWLCDFCKDHHLETCEFIPPKTNEEKEMDRQKRKISYEINKMKRKIDHLRENIYTKRQEIGKLEY